MAKMTFQADDVLLALKNETVKAKPELQDKIVIPQNVSTTGRKRNIKVDLSSKGAKYLDTVFRNRDKKLEDADTKYQNGLERLEEYRRRAYETAWEELNKVADSIDESRGKTPVHVKDDEKEDDDVTSEGSTDSQGFEQGADTVSHENESNDYVEDNGYSSNLSYGETIVEEEKPNTGGLNIPGIHFPGH